MWAHAFPRGLRGKGLTFFKYSNALSYGAASSYSTVPERVSLVDRLPEKAKKFAQLSRLDKPIGNWLLFLPCTWSIALAAPVGELPDLWYLGLFGAGSVLMRSAGCIMNDMWDHDVDPLVERTKNRPIASGAISLTSALAYLNVNLALAACILWQLNSLCICMGLLSVAPVMFYPLCKRIMNWPQLFLGATINLGALLGHAAVTGEFHGTITIPLYMAGICWTMIYDTVYAHQDKRDDMNAGVQSTAISFGSSTKTCCGALVGGMTTLLALSAAMADCQSIFYLGLLSTTLFHSYLLQKVDLNKPSDCWHFFTRSKHVGLALSMSIVADRLFPLTII